MAREKELYRENLDRLDEAIKLKEILQTELTVEELFETAA